jgi:hypothetical protein
MIGIKANAAYLCGNQNICIIGNNIMPLSSPYSTDCVCNLILPAVVNDIATSTATFPVFDVVPAGTDEDDKATAKAGSKILPYLQRINGYSLHRGEVVLWYDLDGIGWRKVYYDPFYSIEGYNPPAGMDGHNPNLADDEPVYRGEVVIEHVPNTQVIFDFRVKDPYKLEWVIHAQSVTLGWLEQRYGSDFIQRIPAGQIKYEPGASGEGEFEVSIMGELQKFTETIAPPPARPQIGELLEMDKVVDHYEYWQKPTRNMPTGAYCAIAGNTMAFLKPYPIENYPHKELPLVPAAPIPLSGIMVGSVPRISQARPLQREYNELRSLMRDNLSAMGNAVMFTQRGAELNFKKIANLPGLIVEYDGPGRPQRDPGIAIPATSFAYLQEVKNGMDEIFAFHGPTKGKFPRGGPRSARGLESLKQSDYTQQMPVIGGFEESDQKVIYQALTLAFANYGQRLLPIVGDDYRWTLYEVNTAELQGKVNVIVKRNSSLPLDKVLESEKAFRVWQSGLLGDPMNSEVRLSTIKQMDLGNVENILQMHSKQSNFARKEFSSALENMLKMPPVGQDWDDNRIAKHIEDWTFVPDPNSFDDHAVHIHEHGEYAMGNYWKFVSESPQHKTLMVRMLYHIDQHKEILMQDQIRQLQMNAEFQAYARGQSIEQIEAKKVDRAD